MIPAVHITNFLCALFTALAKLARCMHAPMQRFQNAPAYFVTAVNYAPKMFMKSAPGLPFLTMSA
jgi:hypothetical protein